MKLHYENRINKIISVFKTGDFKFWYKFSFGLLMIVWILQTYIILIVKNYTLLHEIEKILPQYTNIEDFFKYLTTGNNKLTTENNLLAFFNFGYDVNQHSLTVSLSLISIIIFTMLSNILIALWLTFNITFIHIFTS